MNVVKPGEAGYEIGRFNTAVQERPAAVVTVTSAQDVADAVRYAVDQDLPVAVQATGHATTTPADGAVLINTRGLTGVEIDPAARTARVAAGTQAGAVVAAAHEHGLAPINGASGNVGFVGYTLAGGLGPLGRQYGFAVDHVRSLEIVTAEGKLVTASPSENEDLFWAARGTRGNFGVVTALTVDLVPVSRLYGGALFFDASPELLSVYREWVASVPEEMTSSIALLRLPPIEAIPEPLRGKFLVTVRIAYTGGAADGESLVKPLRDAAPAIVDAVREMPYREVASIHNDPTDPAPGVERSGLLGSLPQEALDVFFAEATPELTIVELRHLGGALGRAPSRPSPVGFRSSAEFSLFTATSGPPEALAAARAQGTRLVSALAPWRVGGGFVCFLGGEDLADMASVYEPDDYRRLRELKGVWDPGNVFRINHNIPPA
ncbi:FAD-binding oxidoreductase [Actinophytocola sp. KF-1]